jgi:hypothetical protein
VFGPIKSSVKGYSGFSNSHRVKTLLITNREDLEDPIYHRLKIVGGSGAPCGSARSLQVGVSRHLVSSSFVHLAERSL